MKYVFSTTLALALLTSAPALAQDIDVMTQNQYLGADLTPIINAPAAEFNEAVITALEEVAANDFESRARALAELIAKRLPELVGLQEVFAFGCVQIGAGPGCDSEENPALDGAFNDHLTATLAALELLGEPYEAVATVENLSIPQIPLNTDDDPDFEILVSVLDRDVILARKADVAPLVTPLNPSNFCPANQISVNGCNFNEAFLAPTPLDAVPVIKRGWVGVDYAVDEETTYRFVDTHLEVQFPDPTEPLSSFYQAAQAAELIGTLANTTPDTHYLIVVGDINSSSEDPQIPGLPPPPYMQFGLADYTDAWDLRPGAVPGYSCCQAPDLSNHQSEHDERIDVIFSLDVPSKVKKARVLGSKVSDKTATPADDGLWPSDHGSVAAELQFD